MLDKFERLGKKLKKTKIVMILLMAVLVFSVLNVAASALLQFLGYSGTGKITSQSILASASTVQPNITLIQIQRGGDRWATNVTGIFQNNEKVDVYGVATATVGISTSETKTQSSNRTLIPAGQNVWILISFQGLPYENFYACSIKFAAEPIQGSTSGGATTGDGTGTTGSGNGGTTKKTGTTAGGGFNFASVGIPIIGVAVVVVGGVTGFMLLKKMKLSEQKVRRFTSYEYQDWVMQRLGGRAGSVLDSRKGIDGFTGDNTPIAIKQSDSVGRLQVDSFMNAIIQTRARHGVMVAFDFDTEALAAVNRAKMNRIDIKLLTVKELIEHRETAMI
jgi:hypothetical protein